MFEREPPHVRQEYADNKVWRGMKFGLPISLALWLLIFWLVHKG